MKEFIMHLVHPLFICVDPIMHGYYNRNPYYFFLIHGIGPLIVLLIIASYQAGSVTAIDRTEWLLPFLCFVLHRSSVSLKYASLHPTEYQKLRLAPVEESLQYQQQLQILQGWLGNYS